jgi:acetolactate synthase-1/2/3 large subunit
LLLALGVRFDDRVTGKLNEFAKHGKIVHIDIDASETNKNKVAQIPIVSDVGQALRELVALLDRDSATPGAGPHRYTEWVRQIVTTGVGQHQMWAAQYFHFNNPRHWLTSGGLGAMGFGLPAALGAQAAHPAKTVIDIDGDGSFLMNIQELACAYCARLPVKVLLLNNQHLGMVVQWEDRFYESNRAHTYLGAGLDQDP